MRTLIALCMLLVLTQHALAQDTIFEKKVSEITQRIDSITSIEKRTLKKELQKIDKRLDQKELTTAEAKSEKEGVARRYADRINKAVAIEEEKLQGLIKAKVNGNLSQSDENNRSFFSIFEEEDNFYKDSITGMKVEKRWTSQFVLILGTNIFDGDNDGFYGDGFETSALGYGEVGFSFKYRLSKTSNLLNLKLGFSTMIEEIRPEREVDIFVTNGIQTTLQDSGLPIIRSYLTNVYLALPIHFELDFSKPKFDKDTKQTYLKSQTGFRLGLGGYVGLRVGSIQFIRYNDADGKRIRINQRDNFNVNDVIFGPSAYLGYGDISLYVKYNATPIFRNNPEDVNAFSVGLRFDFN